MNVITINGKEYGLRPMTLGDAFKVREFISEIPVKDAFRQAKEWNLSKEERLELVDNGRIMSRSLKTKMKDEAQAKEVMAMYQERSDVIQLLLDIRLADHVDFNDLPVDSMQEIAEALAEVEADDDPKKKEVVEAEEA